MNNNDLNRFYKYVDLPNNKGCLNWLGALDSKGYSRFKFKLSKNNYASLSGHRVIYEHYHGPILNNLIIRHCCDNPKCVNINHLLIGTHQDNMDDKVARGRTVNTFKPKPGIKNHKAKLVDQDIFDIRAFPKEITNIEIATKYNVTHSMISLIRLRKSWKHI